MRTIAVTIDETTLDGIDRLVRSAPAGHARRRGPKRARISRSQVVRMALQDFLARRQRAEREGHERRVFAKHRAVIARQAAALVAEQAEP